MTGLHYNSFVSCDLNVNPFIEFDGREQKFYNETEHQNEKANQQLPFLQDSIGLD